MLNRYDVKWSPCLPAVVSTCSFDRSVQFYSLSGAKSSLGRAPKWLRKPVGATFGFGGKLASFDNNPSGAGGAKKSAASGSVDVKITQVVENEQLVKSCQVFQNAVQNDDFKNFCNTKSESALTEQDRSVWKLMRVICFEDKAREELLNYLGFDTSQIVDMASQYAQSLASRANPISECTDSTQDWASGITAAVGQLSLGDNDKNEIGITTAEMVNSAVKGEEAEHMIRKALIVGNFSSAVDICLEAGLMTEALLLAQCGDPELWARTQHEFFVRQRKRKPFLDILHSVIKNELMTYVLQSDLTKWRETLALLSTYGKSEEFNGMCEALANRLETELKDIPSATLCYMCSTNVERTIEFWAAELSYSNQVKGSTDTTALQQFVEKVVVYTSAHKIDDLGDACGKYFAEYAGLLASQGILDVAPHYLKGSSDEENILRDRLFHAGPKHEVGARPPPFPFDKVNVAAVTNSVAIPPDVTKSAAETFANPSIGVPHGSGSQQQQQNVAAHQQQIQQQNQQNQHVSTQQIQHPVQQQQQEPAQSQSGLPPGWIQLVDPSSNRPYYVDQNTGQSQWEPPTPVAQPSQQIPSQLSAQHQQVQHPVQNQNQQGFQQQHQHQHQHQHQQESAQPTQQQSFNQEQSNQKETSQPKPTVKEALEKEEPVVISGSDGGAASELQVFLDRISGLAKGGDKRQVAMIKGSLTALHKQISEGKVHADTMAKLDQMVAALHAKNSAAANVINTDLTNTVWSLHKDWIKGLKYLIQLHCKY